METLQIGQIRVHLKDGTSYDCPEANKSNVIRCVTGVARIVHYKPPKAAPLPKAATPEAEGKTKASLLGDLLKDNKINADELIKWVEASESIEDIGIVMKGEGRATVKKAAKDRINKLL